MAFIEESGFRLQLNLCSADPLERGYSSLQQSQCTLVLEVSIISTKERQSMPLEVQMPTAVSNWAAEAVQRIALLLEPLGFLKVLFFFILISSLASCGKEEKGCLGCEMMQCKLWILQSKETS